MNFLICSCISSTKAFLQFDFCGCNMQLVVPVEVFRQFLYSLFGETTARILFLFLHHQLSELTCVTNQVSGHDWFGLAAEVADGALVPLEVKVDS